MRPGHVCLPATALLCLLLWRMGMLTSRVLALVLFTRLYSCWVLAVAGTHWMLMSFWLVALQSDIVAQPCHWRLFNVLLGAVYIFCYINVQPGPSKHRMAVFYVVMLMENTLLLLLATEFLQAEMGHSLCVSGAAMAGAALGVAAMVVYYSLLHPKSSKIRQGVLENSSCAAGNERAAGNSSCMGQSWGISDGESLAAERTTVTPKTGNSSSLFQLEGHSEDGWTNHHHWLLVKLALKTGDVSKINAAFGDAGVGELYPDGWAMGTPQPGAEPSLPTMGRAPPGLGLGLLEEKLMVVRNGGGSEHEVGAGRDRGRQEAAGHPDTPSPHSSSASLPEGSSVYFSASTGGITSPGAVMVTATSMTPLQGDSEAHSSLGCPAAEGGRGEDLSLGTVSISTILGSCAHRHLQSDCGVAGPPEELSVGTEGALLEWHHLQDTHPCGMQGVVGLGSKLRPPRFTSTPKADSKCSQQGLRDVGEGKDVSGMVE
uniref:XK-related protein n=1 Tax=Pavo cristatus TaxID=9049 RepID=A0A8C9FGP7_PAVCR